LPFLFIRRNTRSTAIAPLYAPYRVDIVGCADEGGASSTIDGLRKLSPSYGPARLEFGEDIGEKAFLERYAQARQADLDRVIRFTDTTVRIFSTDFFPAAFARNAGLLALDRFLPGKRLLAQYAMGLGNRIPRFCPPLKINSRFQELPL